jgi:hypothetical protein
MAFKLAELFVEITTKDSKLVTGLGRARRSINDVGASAVRAGTIVAGMSTALAYAGYRMIKLAGDQEEALEKVRAAFQAQGMDADRLTAKYDKFASTIQKTTTVGDEEVLSLVALATNMGVAENKIEEATKGAIGLSKAFGMDVKMSMRAVSLAMNGQTTLLTRYIPQLQGVTDKTKALKIVNDAMAKGFTQAQAETKTINGSMGQFSNRVFDVGEKIGFAVLKNAEFGKGMERTISMLEDAFSEGSPAINAITGFANGLSAAVEFATNLAGKLAYVAKYAEYLPGVFLTKKIVGATQGALAGGLEAGFDTGAAGPAVRNAQGTKMGFASQERMLAEIAANTRKSADKSAVVK